MLSKDDIEYVFNKLTQQQKKVVLQILHDKSHFAVPGFSRDLSKVPSCLFLSSVCKEERWMGNFLNAVANDIPKEIKGKEEYSIEKALNALTKDNVAEIAAVIAFFEELSSETKKKLDAINTLDKERIENTTGATENSLFEAKTTIIELQNKITQLEEQLRSNKEELKRKKDDLQSEKRENHKLKQENKKISINIVKCDNKLEMAQKQLGQLETAHSDVLDQLELALTDKRELESALSISDLKLQDTLRKRDALQEQCNAAKHRNEEYEQSVLTLKQQCEELKTEYEILLKKLKNRILIYSAPFSLPSDLYLTAKFARASDAIRWAEYDQVYAITSSLSFGELKQLEKLIGKRLIIENTPKKFIEDYRKKDV